MPGRVIRAFVAVELPAAAREEIRRLQEKLKQTGANVKWVRPESLHLTLKFLGNIEEERVPTLQGALARQLAGSARFEFQLEGIGAFPKTTAPRVLWIGVSEGERPLTQLAEQVERACEGIGFPRQERPFDSAQARPFVPHLTLGRVRGRQGLTGLVKTLQAAEFRSTSPAPVGRAVLFRSELSPQGARYTPLAEIPLSAT